MRLIGARTRRDPPERLRWAAWRRLCTRLFVIAFALILLTPATVELLLSRPATQSENRQLASWPAAPRSLAEARQLPARINAYIDDHFGLRYKMIAAHNRLRYALFHELPTPQVIEGGHQRLFLTSHSRDTPYAMIREVCDLGVDDAAVAAAVRSATVAINHFRTEAPSSLLLIVPTAPVIYPEDLPDWLGRRCARAQPLGARVEASLSAVAKSAWAYPLQQMRRLKQWTQVFPSAYFHWFGTAPRRVIESIAAHRLGLVKHVDVSAAMRPVGSDLGQFTAGLQFSSNAALPDWRRAGIDACIGMQCFPELGDIAPVLYDLSRYRNPSAGSTKLLVLSDSFGLHAAGYFAEYAGEVWHLSMDYIARLSPDQLKRFKRVVFGDYDPNVIVGVYHDGALLGGLRDINLALWPDDASEASAERPGHTHASSR